MNNSESRQSLIRILVLIVLLLIFLGAQTTPSDVQGRPLLMLPDIYTVETYRHAALDDLGRLRLLDGEITSLLTSQNVDLFIQSNQAQAVFEHALQTAQGIDSRSAPPVLRALRDASSSAASDYLEAARLALRWVSLGQEANWSDAFDQLTSAQQVLQTLEKSQWLMK